MQATKNITKFIKYNNAVPIAFSVIFLGIGLSLAASPEMRENFVSKEEVVRSVDNSYVLSAELDDFNFNLQIKEITEDDKNYYVVYTYQDIAIQDYSWQEVPREATLTVSKEVLGDEEDLGLYIAEQLGQMIDYRLSYLREVQAIERTKGFTPKIVTTQYAGLIGQFLNPKDKVFPGYTPVVVSEKPIAMQESLTQERTSDNNRESVDRDLIRRLVEEILAEKEQQQLAIASATTTETTTTETTATETTTTEATSTEATSTETNGDMGQTGVTCAPNWQCTDWQPLPETVSCGETVTQSCANWIDSNNCGLEGQTPTTTQEVIGAGSGKTFCDANLNLVGECQNRCVDNILQVCAPECSCVENFSDCDNNLTNGCEVASSTCPTTDNI